MTKDELDTLTYSILGAAYEVRKNLGKYLYEDVYEMALQAELRFRGIESRRQVYYPVVYKGIRLDKSFKIDLLVEGFIPIELKAIKCMGKEEFSQIMSYLVYGNYDFGYLMNFHARDFSPWKVPKNMVLEKGIYRIFRSDSFSNTDELLS